MSFSVFAVIGIYIFRRATISDEGFHFHTGFSAFDEINKRTNTLKEYLSQDIRKGGKFLTYILLKKGRSPQKILLGLCRFRIIEDISELQQELHLLGVDPQVISRVRDYRNIKKMRIIYFSRIGVQEGYQDKNVGKILSNFFELHVKRKKDAFLVYLKIRKNLDQYIGTKYETIGEGSDSLWGDYIVKLKLFLKM